MVQLTARIGYVIHMDIPYEEWYYTIENVTSLVDNNTAHLSFNDNDTVAIFVADITLNVICIFCSITRKF